MTNAEVQKFREVLEKHNAISYAGCEYILNSYEKQRECISGLITEARQVVNTFWETYEYRDKYTDNDCTKALEYLEAAVARAEELLK